MTERSEKQADLHSSQDAKESGEACDDFTPTLKEPGHHPVIFVLPTIGLCCQSLRSFRETISVILQAGPYTKVK
jgi:hypothetical protein